MCVHYLHQSPPEKPNRPLVQSCNFDLFYQCTCTSLQGLGLFGPWCSYTTGIMMYACKLSQCCEDTPVHSKQTSVIFGVKIASEAIFEHLICNIFIYRDTLALTDDILPMRACILAVYYKCHRLSITRTNLLKKKLISNHLWVQM